MSTIEIHYKPLREMQLNETFLDEYGNRYDLSDQEDVGGVELFFTPVGGGITSRRFIGRVSGDGTYTKYEQEQHRYFKDDAWTVNHTILKRADHVNYETSGRQYSIDVQFALDKGRKLTLNSEEKLVLPVKWWDVKAFDKVEDRRIKLMGVEWVDRLNPEMNKDYMRKLAARVNQARSTGKVYPAPDDTFLAFKLTNFSDVRVVILGQDPYPQAYANGLAFGVNDSTIPLPYSLAQLKAELDAGSTTAGFLPDPFDPSLERWARQGVLLLNTRLTVGDKPGSHKDWGWEEFTKSVIKTLSNSPNPIVFLLWGAQAGSYAHLIDKKYHLILNAVHPAASAYKDYHGPGFVGCGHFARTNEFLENHYHKQITW